jgi:AraC-like DNA-binding protein
MKKLTISETAKKVFMSSGHFCRFFKKELGISFTSFVNMYRISQAEEMLKNTKRNISEIAFLTGFGSISQFNRTFKAIKGISAKKFRLRNT